MNSASMRVCLDGRVALVTGASRGLGRSLARRLAKAGATVVVAARSVEASAGQNGTLAETVSLIESAGGRAIPLGVDLDDPDQRDALVARVTDETGRLDILVNNGGFTRYATVDCMPDAVFDQTISHYLRGPFKLSQAAIPVMRSQGCGWIVNVGSCTAQRPLRPYDDHARGGGGTVYAAVKAAIARLTQGLAAELQNDGIAVNLVAPSTAIRTPGADAHIPETYPTEPVEYFAETALELCHRPASERTGLLAHSLHFIRESGIEVFGEDDGLPLPSPELPDYAHPDLELDLSSR